MLKFLIVGLIILSRVNLVAAGELKDQYGRTAQKRELKWFSSVKSSDPAAMGLTAWVFFGNGSRSPMFVTAHLAGMFSQLQYSTCNTIYWLVDGRPITPDETSYQEIPRGGGRSVEVITSTFSVKQFQQLVKAETVKYKICTTEGVVPQEDLEGVRRMMSALGS